MNSNALRPAVHIAAVFGMYLSVAMLVPAAAAAKRIRALRIV